MFFRAQRRPLQKTTSDNELCRAEAVGNDIANHDEIEKALNHDLYFAALNLALTLPDIYGKAEIHLCVVPESAIYSGTIKLWRGVTEKPPIFTEDEPEMPVLKTVCGVSPTVLICSGEKKCEHAKKRERPIPIETR